MKAFAQNLRVVVSLLFFHYGTATPQGLTLKWRTFKYIRSTNHVSCLKTEHAAGPLGNTDEPYNGVTKSRAGQLGRGVSLDNIDKTPSTSRAMAPGLEESSIKKRRDG